MFRKIIALQVTMSLVIVVAACQNAMAGQRDVSDDGKYSFQIETESRVAQVFYHRGAAYVEGRRHQQYAIRVFNHTARRVEAVVTVDGRDVISGDRGDYREQRGYIIEPYGSVLVEGFRRSWNDVAAFYFTSRHDSYASRRGDPINLGVIGVAIFEERFQKRRRPKPIKPLPPVRPEPYYRGKRDQAGSLDSSDELLSEAAPSAGYGASKSRSSRPHRSGQNMGTGYGNDTYSPAVETVFRRRSARRPNSMLKLYYDDYQGLLDKGVRIPPPYRPSYHPPQPFPESPRRFAPAPR